MKLQTLFNCKAIGLFAAVMLFSVASLAETAVEYIDYAEANLDKGEQRAAVIHLKNALLLDPDHAGARLLLGKTYLGLGDAPSAEKELRRARELGATRTEWLAPLGQAWLTLGRQGDLLEAITIEDDDTPDFQVDVLILRGRALIDLRDYPQAEKTFMRVLDMKRDEPWALLGRATVAVQTGDINTALELTLSVDPDYIQKHLLLGTIYYLQDQPEQAQAHLQIYLGAVPGHLSATKLLAATYLKLRQPGKAVPLLEQSLESMPEETQLLVLMAGAYFQNGDVPRGLEYLELATVRISGASSFRDLLAGTGKTTEDTALIQADVLLVLSHLQKKDFITAITDAEDLVRRLPDHPVPYQLAGAAWLGKNDNLKAQKFFQDALERDNRFKPAMINLARIELQAGRLPAARAQYRSILKLDDKNLPAMIGLYQLESVAGRPAEAGKWLERAHKTHPDDRVPGILLAERYLLQPAPDEALQVLRRLLKAHPRDPVVLKLSAQASMATKDYDGAVDYLTALAEIKPNSHQVEYLLATALMAEGDGQSAKRHLKRSIELQANNLPALASLARLETRAGNFDGALVAAKELQRLQPAVAPGYELEGDIHFATKDYPKAAKSYETAFGKAANAELVRKLHQVYARNGQNGKAVGVLEQWIASHPDDASTRIILAGIFHQSGQTEKAIEHYRGVVEADPGNVTALNNLAWLYQDLDLEKSLEFAEQAYRLAGDRADVADTLGWLLLKDGENERGLMLIQDAVNRQPAIGELHYHLAVAQYRNGNRGAARDELQRLLDSGKDFPSLDAAKKLQVQLEVH